jgi:hypothetical protein
MANSQKQKTAFGGSVTGSLNRTFVWIIRFRRLARDYERWPETLAGLHVLVFAVLMRHRFALFANHAL